MYHIENVFTYKELSLDLSRVSLSVKLWYKNKTKQKQRSRRRQINGMRVYVNTHFYVLLE